MDTFTQQGDANQTWAGKSALDGWRDCNSCRAASSVDAVSFTADLRTARVCLVDALVPFLPAERGDLFLTCTVPARNPRSTNSSAFFFIV